MVYDIYTVAGITFQVTDGILASAVRRLAGFRAFANAGSRLPSPEFYFGMRDDFVDTESLRLLYESEAEGVRFGLYSLTGGFVLIQRHVWGDMLRTWSIPDERTVWLSGELNPQMLRFALWTGYGLWCADRCRIAVHGSCIVQEGKAYLFLGESGTGKSTHTRLWREYVPGAELLNDDSPIISVENGNVWVYGSPWSGKTPCYRQERYQLCGCVRLLQAPYNRMTRLTGVKAYAALHPSCPPAFAYDAELYDGLSRTLGSVLSHVPVYRLECLPDMDAALLSFRILNGHGT